MGNAGPVQAHHLQQERSVSFLNQLKSQAAALQNQTQSQVADLDARLTQTEAACLTVWHYLNDLARQLNVIAPTGPKLSLDGKTPWPDMKLLDFRVDSRKKMHRNKEVYERLGMGWRISPAMGGAVGGKVSVNFPPDQERVERRLQIGGVKHERKELRHPEKNTLLSIQYEYLAESRGSVMVTPDHDKASLGFRIANVSGLDVVSIDWPANKINAELMDELAKLVVVQPSRFV
jgi:hypothetical protein